jgi:RNA polymerase sigma factor (sigma-70 family)
MNKPEHSAEVPDATRSSLVERLRDWDDQEGWRNFFDLYWKLLYCVAIKAGLSDSEARDVVQETIVAVARNMREGQFTRKQGSFRAWLLTILHRRIIAHFRQRERSPKRLHIESEGTDLTPLIERLPAPSSEDLQEIWDNEWSRNIADAALERVKALVSPRQYQVFSLYVIKGRPAREVARLLGINIAQVYLAKFRVMALVKKEARNLEVQAGQWPSDQTGAEKGI